MANVERNLKDAAAEAGASPRTERAARNVDADLDSLKADMARLTEQVSALVGSAAGDAMGAMRAQVRRARETVEGAAGEASEAVTDVADTFMEAVEDSLQRRPLTTLGMAVALGFLFGATWRR